MFEGIFKGFKGLRETKSDIQLFYERVDVSRVSGLKETEYGG